MIDCWFDICWIGFCICISFVDSEYGCRELEKVGEKFVGGLWGFVFVILLDEVECGFV